jgi:hypothetical protein
MGASAFRVRVCPIGRAPRGNNAARSARSPFVAKQHRLLGLYPAGSALARPASPPELAGGKSFTEQGGAPNLIWLRNPAPHGMPPRLRSALPKLRSPCARLLPFSGAIEIEIVLRSYWQNFDAPPPLYFDADVFPLIDLLSSLSRISHSIDRGLSQIFSKQSPGCPHIIHRAVAEMWAF